MRVTFNELVVASSEMVRWYLKGMRSPTRKPASPAGERRVPVGPASRMRRSGEGIEAGRAEVRPVRRTAAEAKEASEKCMVEVGWCRELVEGGERGKTG